MSVFFLEIIETILGFLDKGGWVLYVILVLLIVLWSLLINKFLILSFEFPTQRAGITQSWKQRKDQQSWYSRRIKKMLLADLFRNLDSNMAMIKTLIALCPLLGLLGTVSGMIEVFDVMASLGNSSPRAMAAGISKATIPTMAGMVAALSGLLAVNLLNKTIEKEKHQTHQELINATANASH
jgi:biopolymer transport protein ExbB